MPQSVAGATVTDMDHGLIRLKEELERINNSYVLVGFQAGTVTKAQTKGDRSKKAGLSIPEIAAANEFGTKNIPARPFMSTSFEENKRTINIAIAEEYDKIIDGKSTVEKSLGLIGLLMEAFIREKILAIHTPPNSPRTIAIKKSDKPLFDFGQMIDSIQSKVVIK